MATIPLVTPGGTCSPQQCSDTTLPKAIRVQSNLLGDLQVASAPRIDPYVITVDGVEPGARLELLDISKNPNARWGKDEFSLPGSTLNNVEFTTGHYELGLKTETAACLGIKAGRVYLIRQVDHSGNPGPEALTRIETSSRNVQIHLLDGDLKLPAGVYGYTPVPDKEAPVVLTQNIKFERTAKSGVFNLVIDAGVELSATVYITNGRTNHTDQKQLTPNITPNSPDQQISRRLEIPFSAEIGDPLRITIADQDRNYTYLPPQFLEC